MLKNKKHTISFDYDGTLDDFFDGTINYQKENIRNWAKNLIKDGYNVYIITRRYAPENSHMGIKNEHLKVFKLAEEIGISKGNIVFTNRQWKYSFIEEYIGSFIHIDDDHEEKYWLKQYLPNVNVIILTENDWEKQLIYKLKNNNYVFNLIDKIKNIF